MATFLFAYHGGGMPDTDEEAEDPLGSGPVGHF